VPVRESANYLLHHSLSLAHWLSLAEKSLGAWSGNGPRVSPPMRDQLNWLILYAKEPQERRVCVFLGGGRI
jgi:hypothetical protein